MDTNTVIVVIAIIFALIAFVAFWRFRQHGSAQFKGFGTEIKVDGSNLEKYGSKQEMIESPYGSQLVKGNEGNSSQKMIKSRGGKQQIGGTKKNRTKPRKDKK